MHDIKELVNYIHKATYFGITRITLKEIDFRRLVYYLNRCILTKEDNLRITELFGVKLYIEPDAQH